MTFLNIFVINNNNNNLLYLLYLLTVPYIPLLIFTYNLIK